MTRPKQGSKVTLKKDFEKMAKDAQTKVITLEEKNRILEFSVKEQELAIAAMNDVIENQARKRAEHDLIVSALKAERDYAIKSKLLIKRWWWITWAIMSVIIILNKVQ